MPIASPARRVAFRVLREVEDGGFATDLLRQRGGHLDARDAALATELVLGCLRRQPQLDYLIQFFGGREPSRLGSDVRRALHLGIYQLRYLDRIPPHAAVSESVELMRRSRSSSAAGLVNAVLRKVTREPVGWTSREVELCLPEWLRRRWDARFGRDTTDRIAFACLTPPETYLRVPAGREEEALALPAEPTAVPGCFLLLGDSPGPFRIQDISSQTVVPLLELEAGHRFLDLCAGSGGKTAQALETPVLGTAADRSFDKLRDVPGPRVVLDAAAPLPFRGRFDRILVDAPCSGTGTLRRNPEIRWRIQPTDPEGHHGRQVAMLSNALSALAPGGRLVYSTCSLEREENEWVVEVALKGHAQARLLEQVRRTPGLQAGDGFYAAVITSQ